MKTLSIVIPVYNTEKYLRRCLDSVLIREALPYLELIIVNDGSKDGSAELIREYAAAYPDTIVFIDKENGGHGSTINAGLKAATGKYFRVLDSDDWFDSAEFMEYLRELQHCDEDLVVTPYTQEYTYNGSNIRIAYPFFEHDEVYHADELAFDEKMMYYTMASSSYKTELLRRCGLELFEKCFYVDMQYNVYPIPYLKTIRFLDHEVYRYFFGRPEQSMSSESLMRNFPNHRKVLTFLVDYYARFRDSVSENVRGYLALIIYFMFYTFMDLCCMQLPDRKMAYETIKEFDAYLKLTAPDLYEMVDVFPYLHYSRKLHFINVRFLNKLSVKLMILARNIKAVFK